MKAMLDQQLKNTLLENHIAGMSVAVTDAENLLYANGFGADSLDRPEISASAESLYRVASITKIVTGMVLMKLCEAGKLSLDQPVSAYVPWLHMDGAEQEITLRHLLSHTAGLPREYNPDGPREEDALGEALRRELGESALLTKPEECRHLYSNLGIRLASYIAQQVTGKPYSQLARELVLEPLGMSRSTFDLRAAATYPLSLPHEEGCARHYIKENAARLAAGGLYSNVLDLAKLARCLLHEGQPVLNRESFLEMTKPHHNPQEEVAYVYGLTIQHFDFGSRQVFGHLGNANPYTSSLLVDPKAGIGVVLLMNTYCPTLRTELPKLIFDLVTAL